MKYPKLRELKEALRAIIKGPYTTSFPKKPVTVCERLRGRPYFHEQDCIGCAACAQVCPTGAIEFKDEVVDGKWLRSFVVHWDVCIFCGQCQANCPTGKGIILSSEFAFATCKGRSELQCKMQKELVICEHCGNKILPYEQYLWVAARLGVLCFTNPSLIVFSLRRFGLALKDKFKEFVGGEIFRDDRFRILCPRCRREVVIKS